MYILELLFHDKMLYRIFFCSKDNFKPKPLPQNPKGFYENYDFRKINDQILEKVNYNVKSLNYNIPFISIPLPTSADNHQYKNAMLEKLDGIEDLLDYVELGGGMHHHERLAARGKMSVRDRIANFLDPDTPFLEISSLAAYASDYPVGGGAVAGIGIVAGTEVVIFANDPTVLAGAMHAFSGKKWSRAMEISRVNKIPYVQFVESAGGDLRMGGGKGKKGAAGTISVSYTHLTLPTKA